MVTAEIQHKTQKGEELKQRFVYVWRSRARLEREEGDRKVGENKEKDEGKRGFKLRSIVGGKKVTGNPSCYLVSIYLA